MNVLTRIQRETSATDKRIKNNKERITSVYANSRKSPDVLASQGSRSDYKTTYYKHPCKVERVHQSVVEPDQIECSKCRKRTGEKEISCASSGKIETGGLKVTKGSSVKGDNLLSSRLEGKKECCGDTFSQHSMFCSTMKKKS